MNKNIFKRLSSMLLAFVIVLTMSFVPAFAAGAIPDSYDPVPDVPGMPERIDPWEPTQSPVNANDNGKNKWQIVDGDYFDENKGITTETCIDGYDIDWEGNLHEVKNIAILRKTIIPTDDENIFKVVLKVRTLASWADILDATKLWFQNGNRTSSSKFVPLNFQPTSTQSCPVTVNFMAATTGMTEDQVENSKLVYKKIYYADPSNSGMWYLYYRCPMINLGTHSAKSQSQKIVPGIVVYVPVGSEQTMFDQLNHAVVANNVVDIMGPGMTYVDSSAEYMTSVPDATGTMTKATTVTQDLANNKITWNIDSDKTIRIGQNYKLVLDGYINSSGQVVADAETSPYSPDALPRYYREYDLVYKVHLDTSVEGFDVSGVYDTNTSATLNYSYDPRPETSWTDYPDDQEKLEDGTGLFPVPQVKGTLYNLQFQKVDSKTGKPLNGAEFKLDWGYGVSGLSYIKSTLMANKTGTLTATSKTVDGVKGIVQFENLPWGSYDLEETVAPKGHYIDYDGVTIEPINVTNHPELVTARDDGEYDVNITEFIENGKVKNPPLDGATITIRKAIDNADDMQGTDAGSTTFDISMKQFKKEGITLFDEEGEEVTDETVTTALSTSDSVTYSMTFDKGVTEGQVQVTESSTIDPLFSYVNTTMAKNDGNKGTDPTMTSDGKVTLHKDNDVTVTVHNKYELAPVELLKVDSVTGDPLEGAEFAIYTKNKDLKGVDQTKTYTYEETTYYFIKNMSASGSDGISSAEGLPYTEEYLIIETKAPANYFAFEGAIPFKYEDKEVQLTASGDDFEINGDGQIVLKDHKYYELPSTGGIGDYPLALVGGFLAMLGMLVARRKISFNH